MATWELNAFVMPSIRCSDHTEWPSVRASLPTCANRCCAGARPTKDLKFISLENPIELKVRRHPRSLALYRL